MIILFYLPQHSLYLHFCFRNKRKSLRFNDRIVILGKTVPFKDGFSLNSTHLVLYFNCSCSYMPMLKLDPVYPDVINGRVPDKTMGNSQHYYF